MLAWSDLNADAKVQLGEFSAIRQFSQTAEVWHDQRWQQRPTYGYRYFTVNDDMSLRGSWGLRIPSPKIRPDGTPIYDLKQAQFTIPLTRDLSGSESGRSLIVAPNDRAILEGTYKATAPGLLGYHLGKQRWVFNEEKYPTRPGLIVQPTRLLGPAFVPPQGQANGVWAMSSERGSIFLFTTDGLFIQTIAGDMRTTRLLITRMGEQTQAMPYRPVHPAIPSDRAVRFDSPIGSTVIDQVLDVSNRLTLKQEQDNYELAIGLVS